MPHGFFHVQKNYKSSEQWKRSQVREFTPDNANTAQDESRESGLRKLAAIRLPVGTRIDWERAERAGLTREEFDAICAQRNDLGEVDFKTLQAHVRSGFRPTPRSGYVR